MKLTGCINLGTRPPIRRLTIAAASLLSLSFLFVVTLTLKPFQSTAIYLEEIYDPGRLEAITLPKKRVLLVSAMFPLPKSKHSAQEYEYWVSKFLQPITTDIYFFTTPDFAPIVRKARGPGLPITIDTSYASPFSVPPLEGLEQTYIKMHSQDRENFRHYPDLYAVWNAKPFFLSSAVKILASQGEIYDYAFWNDGGSFRDEHAYKSWPDSRRVDQIWQKGSRLTGKNAEDLLFFPLYELPPSSMRDWKENMGPVDYDISEGRLDFFRRFSSCLILTTIIYRIFLWRFSKDRGMVFADVLRVP